MGQAAPRRGDICSLGLLSSHQYGSPIRPRQGVFGKLLLRLDHAVPIRVTEPVREFEGVENVGVRWVRRDAGARVEIIEPHAGIYDEVVELHFVLGIGAQRARRKVAERGVGHAGFHGNGGMEWFEPLPRLVERRNEAETGQRKFVDAHLEAGLDQVMIGYLAGQIALDEVRTGGAVEMGQVGSPARIPLAAAKHLNVLTRQVFDGIPRNEVEVVVPGIERIFIEIALHLAVENARIERVERSGTYEVRELHLGVVALVETPVASVGRPPANQIVRTVA